MDFLVFARVVKLFSFFQSFLSTIYDGALGSSQLRVARLLLPPHILMYPHTSTWSILRCTPYESLQVHTFASQYEAESACETLIRMSSPEREYWYEVAEIIEIL